MIPPGNGRHGLENDFTALLLREATAAGVSLTEHQARLLLRHVDLMLQWNRRVNLTRITRPGEIIVKHLLDSLEPARVLPRAGAALDVGTGAGFPGVPLKIAHPDLDMVLLDASLKKVSFLKALLAELGLKNIRAAHGRWEEFAAASKNGFRLITMRAVRLLPEHLLLLASQALEPGGVFAWWAGPGSGQSAGELSGCRFPGLAPRGQYSYALPGLSAPRSVWTWEKTAVAK